MSVPQVSARRWLVPLGFVVLLIVVALGAPLLAPYTPGITQQYDTMGNLPPSAAHPFGTDGAGRDVLSRVLYGARISLSLGFAAATLAVVLGTLYGALAAMLGGAFDRWMMRALDVALSMPRLLLLLAVTAFSDRLPLPALILLLGTTGWFDVARLVRGEVQGLLHQDYLIAARATGIPTGRTLVRHVLPHLLPLLAVSVALNVASTISLEAGLSYLGLGIQPPTPSWGTILQDGAADLGSAWWLTVFPGLAIIIAVVACHALGDALRDLFALDQVPA